MSGARANVRTGLENEAMDHERLIVIPSHEDILLKDLTARQLIGGELALQ
jgi:hypothetical protein